MATYTWHAPGGGDFNVAANWSIDGTSPATTSPGPADTADFDSATTGTISGNANVYRIEIETAAADLTFTGQITLSDGVIDFGTLALASGASITNSGGFGVAVFPNNSGTLIIGPGASYHGNPPAETANYEFAIAYGDDATRTAIVQGPGALLDTGVNGDSIGNGTGSTGSLRISAGGVVEPATTNPATILSLQVGRQGTGSVTVDGVGSQLLLTSRRR